MILSKEGMNRAKTLAKEFNRINKNKNQIEHVKKVWEEIKNFMSKMIKALKEVIKPLWNSPKELNSNLKREERERFELGAISMRTPIKIEPQLREPEIRSFNAPRIRNQI